MTSSTEIALKTLEVVKTEDIAAPIEMVFEALLEQLGPENERPDGVKMPMKIEPRPGGRWYRDLGDDQGHFWGHVQVIKSPTLLEICGPLFMSYPAASHLQYRLTPQGDGTRLVLTHRAFGQIPPDHSEGVSTGWSHLLKRVRATAESRK